MTMFGREETMIKRDTILLDYTVENGTIRRPGRFEGERADVFPGE